MCGIVGCLALAPEAEPDPSWVATATQRISHRGPDDEGFYSDNDVALGYKRLAIIDLSQAGHQPMRSADGRYWMVFNGEIYNYVELGRELLEQGVVLRSSCDSEVLLEAYARAGKDVVHRLRGMYAFAIWDSWTRELFCADVQQDSFEEVNIITRGANYGWRRMEGDKCFDYVNPNTHPASCESTGMIDPIVEYPNCNVTQECKGLSITGGFVYRGSHGPWQGKYFFGDWSKQFGVRDGGDRAHQQDRCDGREREGSDSHRCVLLSIDRIGAGT